MATKQFHSFVAVCAAILVPSVLTLPTASVQGSEQERAGEVKTPPVLQKPMPETLQDLQEMQAHVKKIIAKVMPAVVNAKMAKGGQGSGVVVSEDGMVLTAAHVSMAPGTAFTLTFPDGRQVKGKALGRNITADSGLIQIVEPGKYPYCEMGNSADLKKGDWCLAIGHGGGLKPGRNVPPVRLGRINGVAGIAVPDKVGWLSTDATLIGGDSGGPLFDMQGRVIGIHAQILDALTSNFHVPVDTFRLEWPRLIKGEVWGTVRDKPLPPTGPASFSGVAFTPGARELQVASVAAGSAAEKAGLKSGDLIVAVNGKRVAAIEQYQTEIINGVPDSEVTLEVRRGIETLNLKGILGKADY